MFEAYQITIVERSGHVVEGFAPRIDPDNAVIRFAPRQDALMTGQASLRELRVIRFTRISAMPDALDELPEGNAVKVYFDDGEVLIGKVCPISVKGGLWLRPDGHSRDNLLLLVPDGSAKNVEWVSGKPPGAETLPPPPVSLSASDTELSNQVKVPAIHADAAEDATALELDIMTSSDFHPLPTPVGSTTSSLQIPISVDEPPVEELSVVTEPNAEELAELATEAKEAQEDCAFDEDATLRGAPPPLSAIARAKANRAPTPESTDTLQSFVQVQTGTPGSADGDSPVSEGAPGLEDTAESPVKEPGSS